MFRIAALNDSDSGDDNTTTSQHAATTKEAKEAEAFSLYSRALSLQREGDVQGAERTFKNLVSHEFLIEAARLVDEEIDNVVHPGLQLLYSIYKNLAAIAAERGDLHTAMKSYLEAVKIDWSEVTVWYKIGTIGLKIYDYALSRLAFEQGLQCNPNHWPCLDNLITVSYALNDYWRCLHYISKALEKDCNYEKGIALRDEMFREQASLRQDSKDMFVNCDPVILNMKLDKEDAEEYVEEALAMRRKNRELAQRPPRPVIKFPERIKSNTWKSVGEALIALYNHATQAKPHVSLSMHVDMTEYEIRPGANGEEDTAKTDTKTEEQTHDVSEKDKEINMETDEPADVVDGDLKSGNEKNQKEEPVKQSKKSDRESVVAASVEVLDESKSRTDAIKSESSDFQTTVVASLAEDVVDTPRKVLTDIKDQEKLDTDIVKMEMEEVMDEDGDEYSISAGLDISPGQPDSQPAGDPMEETTASRPLSVTPIDSGAKLNEVQSEQISSSSAVVTCNQPSEVTETVPVQAATPVVSANASEAPQVMSNTATPIIRGMLGYPPVSSAAEKADDSSQPSKPVTHPLVAAQLISTPKSSLLLSTAMPPVTSGLHVTVPNPAGKMVSPPLTPGLLSPVPGMTPPLIHSAPNTPDILQHNPFMRSPQSVENSAPRSQSLLSIALTQPPAQSLAYPILMAGGDAQSRLTETGIPPHSSPSAKSLLSPIHTATYTVHGQIPQNTSPVQTVPLQSNIAKHLSPVQGLLVQTTPASTHVPISQQMSPEESQLIAQHAAAHTLIALAQMPTQLSPQKQTSPGGTLTTANTLASLMSGGVMKQSAETSLTSLPYQLPVEVALHDHPHTLSRDMMRGQGMSRRGAKRKRVSLQMEDAGMKRRSARVRNTSRKKQEDSINMQELLYKFLPSSLLQASDDDEESRTDETDLSLTAVDTTTNKSITRRPSEGAPLESTEEEEVKEFVQKCITNNGIIDLLFRFLTTLADKYNMKWPDGLGDVYVQVYDKLRRHITFPCVFGTDESMTEDDTREYGRICLLWGELKLDQWLSMHSKPTGTPPRGGVHAILGKPRVGEDYQREDLWYLMTLAGSRFLMQDIWLEFAARVYWLKARLSMIQSDKHEADYCFDKLSYVMDCAKEEKDITSYKLQNCRVDDIISKDQLDVQQESLQRSQSLEETQKLYEAGNYDKVVELLLQTFSQPQTAKKENAYKSPKEDVYSIDLKPLQISEMGSSLPERHSQLMLLQDSLFKLQDYKKCLLWGEVSFNEALQQYRRASGQSREDWLSTVRQIFEHTNKVLDKDDSLLKSLPSYNTVRLSQNLIRMIELAMDSSESSSEVPNTVVLSWILLSRLIKSEESKLRSMLVSGEEGSGMDGAISSSLMLLNVAHEYLGRQSWCTKSNGALLLYFLSELEAEMRKPHFVREGLDMALEQCIYCLYGHPNKKGKARHLQDHNAPVITLDWDKAGIVFDYFKPKTVPDFDSYKANTVSAELENLLRRLFLLVPDDVSSARNRDAVENYIEGNTNLAPAFQTVSSILIELYYLLADYYFKNKETSKAIKFYTHDICVNPTRLDSWAGLALARMSQLEQKLSSMELKMDIPVHKKSIAALRCFRRAVEIDETQRKLWIEYGSLAYQLHSHASRQLKMQDWFPLNEELLGIVTETKQEMLQVAHNCYWKASECEADGSEEEWLHHYMIGKVKEKKRCHPRDYLEHYRQAAIYLHEDEAFYPKKITYASSPPKLALEALEVFFRLHVAMLKQLLKKEGEMVDYELFQHYLTEAADSPFARGKEKKHERRESTSLDESSSSNLTPPAYSQLKARPVYHMTPQDHTYSKQKSSVDGSDTSCDVTKDSHGGESTQLKSLSDKKTEGQKSDKSEKMETKCEAMEGTSAPGPVLLEKHGSTGFVPKIEEEAGEKIDFDKDKAGSAEKNESTSVPGGGDGINTAKTESKSQISDPINVTSGSDNVTSDPVQITSDPLQVISDGGKSTTGEKTAIGQEKVITDSTKDISTSADATKGSDTKADDCVLVLDPATGLMVPFQSEEQEQMEVDDADAVFIEDDSVDRDTSRSDKDVIGTDQTLKTKELSDPSKPEAESLTVPSTPSSENVPTKRKSVEVIEISDDDPTTPVKNPVSLSLKRPEQSQKEPETKVQEAKKELFKTGDDKLKSNESSKTETGNSDVPESHSKERKDSVPESESSLMSDNSDSSDSDADQHDSMDREILHTELLDKCIDGLHLCVQRFPTHYKSLYRLAHVYMTSPYHKDVHMGENAYKSPKEDVYSIDLKPLQNLEYARDLLLGNPNWQNLSHMPGPGLFAERKVTNFFQGIWKIPIEEIDRSGSFASHILRSVRLLLQILKEQRDIQALLQVHQQLNRSPDSGKKYLRDQERHNLAKSSFKYIVEAIHQEVKQWDKKKPHNKQLDFLMAVYKAWHHANHKLNAFVDQMREQFVRVFKLVQRDSENAYKSPKEDVYSIDLKPLQINTSQSIFEQAIRFCQQRASATRPSSQATDSNRSLGTSGFMSPPSNKGPTTSTDTHHSTVDPHFTSPKSSQPGVFSPSPKKNQSPFSSPMGQSGLSPRPSSHLDGSKIQTSHSDGSKVSSSQSDVSSVSGASQSEGDDALSSASPGSLTSAVQSQLLAMDTKNTLPSRNVPATDVFGKQNHPFPEPTSTMSHLFDQPAFPRPYTLSSFLSMSQPQCRLSYTPCASVCDTSNVYYACNIGQLRPQPVNLSRNGNTKSKLRHPIASSINLKYVADGMKKKLKNALLSSPRLLSTPKSSTVTSERKSPETESLSKSDSSAIKKQLPERCVFEAVKPIPLQPILSSSYIERSDGERSSPSNSLSQAQDKVPGQPRRNINPIRKKQKLVSLLNQSVHDSDMEVLGNFKPGRKSDILPTESNLLMDHSSVGDSGQGEMAASMSVTPLSPGQCVFNKDVVKYKELSDPGPTSDRYEKSSEFPKYEETKSTLICERGEDSLLCLDLSSPHNPFATSIVGATLGPLAEKLGPTVTDTPSQDEQCIPVTSPQSEEVDLETMIPTLRIRIPSSERKCHLTESDDVTAEPTCNPLIGHSGQNMRNSTESLLVGNTDQTKKDTKDTTLCQNIDVYNFSEQEFADEGIDPSEFSRHLLRSSPSRRCGRQGSQSHSDIATGGTEREREQASEGFKVEESENRSQTADSSDICSTCPADSSVIFEARDGGETSETPMEDIIPSVMPDQISFASYTTDLYEFISDDDTDEHALTIDMDK